MTDIDELLAAFEAGSLLRPDAGVPNLVDLARAIAAACGADGMELSPFARELAAMLGAREHLVVVLADGLGLEMLEAEPAAATLQESLRHELRAVFPASTAVALTTLATGEWPAQHAVTGWWTHLEEIAAPATILQFRRRSDDKPLSELGVEPGTAFPHPSLLPRMQRRTQFLLPRGIAASVYSRYWTGGPAATGYDSLADTFEPVVEAALGAEEPTFTYLYAPHIDHAAHERGPDSREARAALLAIDRLVAALASELGDAARIVVSSDHGHLAVTAEQRLLIRDSNGLPELLTSPPSGDARVLEFHVRDGEHERFAARFRERFGDTFYLLTTAEVEELLLLGPEPLAAVTRARLGDFMAISRGATVLGYQPAKASREALQHRSHHAGLTPAELRVPLAVV